MVTPQTATGPGTKRAGKSKRIEQEPYIDAKQHVRNIAVLLSFKEMQEYIAKHDLYQPDKGDRFTADEAVLIEDALDEKSEELRAAGEAKGNGHDKDAPPVTAADITEAEQLIAGEELTGMQLFARVRDRLLELKNLTDFNSLVEEFDLGDIIDGTEDERLVKTDAAKLKRMLEATCNELTPDLGTNADSVYAGDDAAALVEATEREQRGRFEAIGRLGAEIDAESNLTNLTSGGKKRRAKLGKERAEIISLYAQTWQELADAVGEARAGEVRAHVETPDDEPGDAEEVEAAADADAGEQPATTVDEGGPRVVKRIVEVKLNSEDIAAKAKHAARLRQEIAVLEAEKSDSDKAYKKKIGGLEEEMYRHLDAINAGSDEMELDVFEKFNDEKKTVETRRWPSCELVSTRPMSPREMQRELLPV